MGQNSKIQSECCVMKGPYTVAGGNQNELYAQQKDEKIKAKALQANLGYFSTFDTMLRKND